MPELEVADKAARLVLVELLQPLLPKRWTWIADEAAATDSDRPRARASQRKIEPGGTGAGTRHWVTFALTVTVPSGDGLAAAEVQLDDDIDAFLHALDSVRIPWSEANKQRFADEGNRLGYQVDIRIYTTKRKKAD
jgi:hypothetical protein